MSHATLNSRVLDLLSREARFLDERRWDDWLSLFEPDVVYWVPAWRNESELTADPGSEVSLMYYDSRHGLEDRVWRLRSERSIASFPLLRTAHLVASCVSQQGEAADEVKAEASWSCHVFNAKRKQQSVFFGHYHYVLRDHGERLTIAEKRITLLNDYVPTMLDFYCL